MVGPHPYHHEGVPSVSRAVTPFIENLLCVHFMLGAIAVTSVNKTAIISVLMEFTFQQESHIIKLITQVFTQVFSVLGRAPVGHMKRKAGVSKVSESFFETVISELCYEL